MENILSNNLNKVQGSYILSNNLERIVNVCYNSINKYAENREVLLVGEFSPIIYENLIKKYDFKQNIEFKLGNYNIFRENFYIIRLNKNDLKYLLN